MAKEDGMKERPILFSGEMVRAILNGRKTQTRRVIKPQPYMEMDGEIINQGGPGEIQYGPEYIPVWPPGHRLAGRAVYCRACPYGVPGDRLWVRESWHLCPEVNPIKTTFVFRADSIDGNCPNCGKKIKWKPSIHMPRWASRITLEIVDVRPERLQEISHKDALAEGVPYDVSRPDGSPLARFAHLWDSINGKKYPWASNPWVWVIEFRRTG